MAKAAATAAATEAGVDVRLIEAVNAGPDDVLAADGYLFAAPENLAALSGLMKDFFDRCYYPVLGRINGRPYGLMICAGGDGTNAARQAMRIATGWRLRAVAEPLIRGYSRAKGHRRSRARKVSYAGRHIGRGARHGRILRLPDRTNRAAPQDTATAGAQVIV